MPYSHSFENVTPPARFSGDTAWTTVHVEQSTTSGGSYSEIDEQVIAADPTPETPAPIDISVMSTLEEGWFRFRFADVDDVLSEYSVPAQSPTDYVPVDVYKPTVGQLGAIMRARTKDTTGIEAGTFTGVTRPTDEGASEMIDQAAAIVSGRVGQVPSRLSSMATSLVALRAAMYVEVSYYPEDTAQDESAYERYREQYNDTIEFYESALETGTTTSGGPDSMVFSVPVATTLNPTGAVECCPDELCA